MSDRIEGLPLNADSRPLLAELQALGESSCFDIGGRMTQQPDSAVSLKHYWESGGRDWMRSFLDLGVGDARKLVWREPTVARTLSRESSPKHALQELLCSQLDKACINETRAFRARAMRAFGLQSQRQRLEDWQRETQGQRSILPFGLDECTQQAMKAPEHERFARFLACLEAEPPILSFPLVGIRRPRDGWLRISGRRGHYEFCDEQRAYDLATGSAFVVASCSRLALGNDGGVDSRAADGERAAKVTAGKVSQAALSELTWFLLVAPELEPRAESFGMDLPESIKPSLPEPMGFGGLGLGAVCASSGDTSLDWSYILGGRTLASGTFTWPGCGLDEPHHYLVGLLEFAELTLEEGCTTAYPPPVVRRGPLSASSLDADKQSLNAARQELERAWQRAHVPCKP